MNFTPWHTQTDSRGQHLTVGTVWYLWLSCWICYMPVCEFFVFRFS